MESSSPRLGSNLSQTEGEVLALLAFGWTAAEIGDHLGFSGRSVERHIERLRYRLGAKNIPHLIASAFANGSLKVIRGKITLTL
jgi:DNA-binding CsgD family transcriptional regulator